MEVLNRELSALAVEVPSDPVGIEDLDDVVLRIFALVREALEGATQVFLTADRPAARQLVARDHLIDALHRKAESAVVAALVRPVRSTSISGTMIC